MNKRLPGANFFHHSDYHNHKNQKRQCEACGDQTSVHLWRGFYRIGLICYHCSHRFYDIKDYEDLFTEYSSIKEDINKRIDRLDDCRDRAVENGDLKSLNEIEEIFMELRKMKQDTIVRELNTKLKIHEQLKKKYGEKYMNNLFDSDSDQSMNSDWSDD